MLPVMTLILLFSGDGANGETEAGISGQKGNEERDRLGTEQARLDA